MTLSAGKEGGKVYVRNWKCKKHNTFGDDPFIPCSYCGYSGKGRVKVFESFDAYRKYLGDKAMTTPVLSKPVRERKDKINMRVWSIAWLLGVVTMGSVWWTYNHFFDDQFVKGWCTAVTSAHERDWIFEKISCFNQFPELEDKPTPRPTPANLDDYWCPTMESIEDGSCRANPSNKAPKDSNL